MKIVLSLLAAGKLQLHTVSLKKSRFISFNWIAARKQVTVAGHLQRPYEDCRLLEKSFVVSKERER